MKNLLLILAFIVPIAGCSIKVVPQPVESGKINPDQTLTVTKNSIAMTVGNDQPVLYSYNLDEGVTAFSVVIANESDKEFTFNVDNFVLTDNEGNQFSPLTPDKVREMISKDSYYLIPYPYVGFYYLEDYEKASAYNEAQSQQPYFYELYPQDIFTRALAGTTIIPKAKVNGLLYFKIDLPTRKGVNLLFFRPASSKSAPPDFVFPFAVRK